MDDIEENFVSKTHYEELERKYQLQYEKLERKNQLQYEEFNRKVNAAFNADKREPTKESEEEGNDGPKMVAVTGKKKESNPKLRGR